MFLNLDTNGLILLCAGLLIRYLIGRRRFSRRNFAGRQVFTSYSMGLAVIFAERIFNLLGLLLIIVGAGSLLI